MQDNVNKLQQEIDIEKQKNEQLQKALSDRESRIQRLHDQIEEFKKIKSLKAEDSNMDSSNKFENDSSPRGSNASERRVLTIVDSERMRLLELLAVVNRRLDESRREQMETDAQLRKEKFRNAKLETKVARLELERVGVLKTGRGSYSMSAHKSGDPPLDDADIMARQHIEYLEEECLALKTRIETLQMEKEDDLKVFAAMTDTRDAYDKKILNSSTTKKTNSPRDLRTPRKLPNRKTKRNQGKIGKFFPPGYHSVPGQPSFSSSDSVN
ncbi:hypothetical protein RUM44_012883 [Polyplax serrata]|uniref:Uncharacterized protein n=1 Tax=Polyplax serrata TaxID=468196 RepID=A0ABR1BGA4_POLSC